MKPDWKDAPEWARYLAMDDDDKWFWHELRPEFDPVEGTWCGLGKWAECAKYARESRKDNGTLEPRP